jgi:predicted membrane chloride channel (bestrophin family)
VYRDPFGTELNDLPLERYCKEVHDEYVVLGEMRGKMGGVGSKSSRVLGMDGS